MSQEWVTTRVPGFISRIVGRNCWLSRGNRYSVTTVALLKSSLKMSPVTMLTLSATPAFCTLSRA